MLVANWINLQHYATATDNLHFGSGHKSIHNVVSEIEVDGHQWHRVRPSAEVAAVTA